MVIEMTHMLNMGSLKLMTMTWKLMSTLIMMNQKQKGSIVI